MQHRKLNQGKGAEHEGQGSREGCYFRQMAREGLSEVTAELKPEGNEGIHPAEEHPSHAKALRKSACCMSWGKQGSCVAWAA